jgi:predicted small metal-binding protein
LFCSSVVIDCRYDWVGAGRAEELDEEEDDEL